jgi:hypothetical protein
MGIKKSLLATAYIRQYSTSYALKRSERVYYPAGRRCAVSALVTDCGVQAKGKFITCFGFTPVELRIGLYKHNKS